MMENSPQDERPAFTAGDSPEGNGMVRFGADLNKEEYIRFNEIMARTGGILRHRKGQAVFFGVMLAFSLAMLATEWVLVREIDFLIILLMVFTTLAGGLLLFGMPVYVRRTAAGAYDRSLLNGYTYAGTISVYADRVEKDNGHNAAVVKFAENAGYIETADMMILFAPASRSIVLPARCLTASDADALRRVVLPGIPPARQRLLDRLVPRAQERMASPEPAEREEQAEALITVSFTYTREEFLKMVTDSSLRVFCKFLPVYGIIAAFSALMFGLLGGIAVGLLSFLLLVGMMLLLNVGGNRVRAARSYDRMPQEGKTLRVVFSEEGIVASSPGPGEEIRMAWGGVTRAVERPGDVEFYSGNACLRIPKRCVPDMEELRRLADAHVPPRGR